jgi:hypothetical protein
MSVEAVSLSGSKIGNSGVIKLCKVLHNNPNIFILNLERCQCQMSHVHVAKGYVGVE